MRVLVPLVILLVPAVLFGAAADTGRTETRDYVVTVPFFGDIACNSGNGRHVCFTAQPGESTVTVTIKDRTGLPTAGTVIIESKRGFSFCGSTTFKLLTGESAIRVYAHDLGDRATGASTCAAYPATGGTVSATFR